VLSVGAALIAAPSAVAGQYIVEACGNGPNLMWTPGASPGWTAESNCNQDGTGNLSTGIPDPSVDVAGGTGASYQLAAPGGASVAWIEPTFRIAYASRYGAEFGVFRSDQPGRVWGCDNFNADSFCGGQFSNASYHIDTAGAGAVRIQAGCIYSPGCSAGGDIKLFTKDVKAAIEDGTAPNIGIKGGGLSGASGWVRGVQGLVWDSNDNVGIRGWRHFIDGSQVADAARECSQYQLTCPNLDAGQHLTFDTRGLSDGSHAVIAQAEDRAHNTSQAGATFYSDNTAPAPPQNLAVDGGEDWRSRPGFRVTWALPPDGYSGLQGAVYQLCRARTGECASGGSADSLNGKPPESAAIKVPRQGDWTLQLYLRDNAGNADPNSARTAHLRYDDAPPNSVLFDNIDPSDPRRVAVSVDDPGSGVGGGELEYRPAGASDWRSMSAQVRGDALTGSIDDEALSRGHYELRAIAHDQAGLTTIGDRRKDGTAAGFDIPLRVPIALRAGFVRIKHTRTHRRPVRRVRVLVPTRKVRFGHRATISGTLVGEADGRPLVNTVVEVASHPHADGAQWAPEGTAQTDGEGRFRYQAPPGASRDLRLRYGGTNTIGAATQQLALLVPASSNIRVDRRKPRNGDTITLSGRVRGNPPPPNKLVAVQALVRRRWRTFGNAHTNGNGVWRFPYRFETVTRRYRFRFRARIPHESTFPYEPGGSPETRVLVSP
jgi:hypothetical protein